MLERILVPLDGSAFGEHALPRAIELARRHEATIDLAHVHEVASLVYLEGVPQIDASLELDGIRTDRSYLDRTLDRVSAAGVRASATLLDGPTVAALETHIDATGADLVIMTTHGRGRLSRAWLGSVADGLARHVHKPLLLIRPPEEADAIDAPRPDLAAPVAPLARALVPLDGTPHAEAVIDATLEVTGADGSFALLHVSPPTLVVGGHVFPVEPDRQRRMVDAARTVLGSAVARLEAAGREVDVEIAVSDDAATSILEAATRQGADLVALTTHGRSGISRLLFGSVTDKVLRAASLPVLVRRPPAS